MSEPQSWNSLGYAEKCLVAAKASMNGSALTSEGDTVSLGKCGIDTMKISTLGEYLTDRRLKEGKLVDESLKDDQELAKRFVIPVTLPNGQEIEVIVNKNGQDEACMYRDEAGNENEFQLTPRMRKSIEEMAPQNLANIVGEEVYKQGLFPDNVDEYAEKVQDNTLVPKSKEQAAEMVGVNLQREESKEENQEEVEEAKKEVPAEARDIIAKICSENDLDISNLKEVMVVEPEIICDNLENTGIRKEDGRVYCLRFRDGENLDGRVVMVQGQRAVDERKNDDYMNDYMNEHKNEKVIRNIEDDHDKLVYTDVSGNTTVCEITREPRDLECSEKEMLQAEMAKLDSSANQILASDMPLEMKTTEIIKINQKRLDLFKEAGIEVPLVENEIEADIEISEDLRNTVEEENAEEEKTEEAQEMEEDDAYEHRLPEGPWERFGRRH